MAELKYVESQLGVKFWKIRIKSSATENLLRSLWLVRGYTDSFMNCTHVKLARPS
jgi:hypothetical protein